MILLFCSIWLGVLLGFVYLGHPDVQGVARGLVGACLGGIAGGLLFTIAHAVWVAVR